MLNTANPCFFLKNLDMARAARQEKRQIEANEVIEMNEEMVMFIEACEYIS